MISATSFCLSAPNILAFCFIIFATIALVFIKFGTTFSGNQSKGYIYSGSNNVGDVAWYDSNSGSKTHEVATKSPNELGIYDMSGNVWEWCQDWYGSLYYSNSLITNPTGPSSGSLRVCRGGSLEFTATACTCAVRSHYPPSFTYNDFGFRLAL